VPLGAEVIVLFAPYVIGVVLRLVVVVAFVPPLATGTTVNDNVGVAPPDDAIGEITFNVVMPIGSVLFVP
jgi:hypothetical protein